MRDLLLVACSARKRREPPQPIAAIERYDGIFFRVLRKWLWTAGSPQLDVLIISARFGLLEGSTPIPDYDQRMTAARAIELAPGVQSALKVHLAKPYRRVYVNLGRDYEPTVHAVAGLRGAAWASGPIGKRARQMKQWLEAL